MNEHLTHVLTVNNEQHALCICGWSDLRLKNDGSAYESAAAHKQLHKKEES